MFNFTSNRHKNNTRSVPRPPPPTASIPPSRSNSSSITRSVLEGVGIGAGSAIGRSIIDQGFDSISRLWKRIPDKIDKLVKQIETPIHHDVCKYHIEEYYKCIHNVDGTSEYDNCRILYDNYLECITSCKP